MKRNNIFMWAYITFIAISIILRLLFDYAFWYPIVVAITISSMFFAFEDFFHLLYQTQKKSCDMTEAFVTTARKKTESAINFFLRLDQKAEEYEGSKYDLSILQNRSSNLRKKTDGMLQILDQLEQQNDDDRKKEERLKRASYVFAYIGFLLLFVSLIMCTLISIPQLVQEMLTVFSFAIILVTQQINNIAVEKIQKEDKKNKDLIEKFNLEDAEWTTIAQQFDEMVESIDKKINSEETQC